MIRTTLIPSLRSLAAAALAVAWVGGVYAQPAGQTNYQWSAGGDKMTWSQPANWTQGIVPPADGTTYQIDTSANAGGSLGPINIGASDVVAINDAIFGPLWGQTMNISGHVTCGFGEFVWGDGNSGVTTLNVLTNASLSLGDTLALGTAWWFAGGPNVVLNVYTNAFVGVAWMQFGARLNIYGGTVSVTNGFNTGTATGPVFTGGADTDATRSINLTAGSTLVLPAGATGTVNDWLARGILQVYGAPASADQIVIDEANADWPGRTVVTTTATGPSVIVAVRIDVPRTNLFVGGVEQALVFADYTTATDINITSTATNLLFVSSNTNVLTVTAGGRVRATGVGSATVQAIVGTLSNSVSIAVAAYTNITSMVHRYSFDGSDGITAADSIGGPTWDGYLTSGGGGSIGGGKLVLDGVDSYLTLPPAILSGFDAVTIETWASFGSISNWAVLFTFGDTDGTFGHNYISCQPHTGGATAQTGIRNATTEQNAVFTPVLDGYTNVHIVAVYHPEAGYLSIYTNGMLAAINSNITVTLSDALATGDPLNYIGRSLWSADPYLATEMDEFRIYNGPLTLGQIKADAALGPNQLIGTSTNVTLTVSAAGGNVIVSWPTNSALVNLMSSSSLGSNASWTPVNGTLAVQAGAYKMTVPASAATQFFRLQQ